MKSNRLIIGILCIFSICVVLAACSSGSGNPRPNDANDSLASGASGPLEGAALEEAIAKAQPDDPYVADEVCLNCHGGTYEAIAGLTDAYGDSNPHAGAHGNGTMACNTCHVDGKTKPTDESNYCLTCHDWPREEQAYLEYMDL